MPVVGFHQARRLRRTPADRLRELLSWPNPVGILVSIVGAAMVLTGAVALGEGFPRTTTSSSQVLAPPSPSPVSTARPTPSNAPTALAPEPTATPLILGADANAPIQKLFASGTAAPADRGLWDIANPASPLVLVNKQHPLVPKTFEPADLTTPNVMTGGGEAALLRPEAATAVERMFAAASSDGVHITIMSGYRSYDTQATVYNGYIAQNGQDISDTTSARPGFSEHQTGFALDIGDTSVSSSCAFTICMAETPAGRWVAAHGADYGFVIRYRQGQEPVTGYSAEPWHLRFLGIAVAQDMNLRGIFSYETYLGLPSAPGYE